jgi:hypothetical protein
MKKLDKAKTMLILKKTQNSKKIIIMINNYKMHIKHRMETEKIQITLKSNYRQLIEIMASK